MRHTNSKSFNSTSYSNLNNNFNSQHRRNIADAQAVYRVNDHLADQSQSHFYQRNNGQNMEKVTDILLTNYNNLDNIKIMDLFRNSKYAAKQDNNFKSFYAGERDRTRLHINIQNPYKNESLRMSQQTMIKGGEYQEEEECPLRCIQTLLGNQTINISKPSAQSNTSYERLKYEQINDPQFQVTQYLNQKMLERGEQTQSRNNYRNQLQVNSRKHFVQSSDFSQKNTSIDSTFEKSVYLNENLSSTHQDLSEFAQLYNPRKNQILVSNQTYKSLTSSNVRRFRINRKHPLQITSLTNQFNSNQQDLNLSSLQITKQRIQSKDYTSYLTLMNQRAGEQNQEQRPKLLNQSYTAQQNTFSPYVQSSKVQAIVMKTPQRKSVLIKPRNLKRNLSEFMKTLEIKNGDNEYENKQDHLQIKCIIKTTPQ